MIINVSPVVKNENTCIDAIFETIASFFKRDFQLMFLGSWGFEYNTKNPNVISFGEKIGAGRNKFSRELIYRYHGIKVTWETIDNPDLLNKIIIENIKELVPIGVYIDSYHCPWNPVYKKSHIEHYCLIIGFDQNTEEFLCLDPYFSESLYKLPFINLRKGYKEFISFTKAIQQLNEYSLKEIIEENIINYAETHFKNMFEVMHVFSGDIEKFYDMKIEIEGHEEDIKNILLLRRIKVIGDCRINFSKSLRYLSNMYDENSLLKIAENIEIIGNEWNGLNMLFIKSFITKNNNLKFKISEVIDVLASKEEEIFSEIGRLITKF